MGSSRMTYLLLASLSLSACASTSSVRSLANRTGVFVQSLNSGTADFIERQNRLNTQNEAHLERLAINGARDRSDTRRQRLVWTNQGLAPRLAAQDRLQAVTANDIAAGLAPVQRQAPARIGDGPTSGYVASLAALVEVSTVPNPAGVLAEMIEFGQEVREALGTLRDAAATTAQTAGTATQTADNATANAAAAAIPH
jgi:hypothetical protein